jgi:hypothetical protein
VVSCQTSPQAHLLPHSCKLLPPLPPLPHRTCMFLTSRPLCYKLQLCCTCVALCRLVWAQSEGLPHWWPAETCIPDHSTLARSKPYSGRFNMVLYFANLAAGELQVHAIYIAQQTLQYFANLGYACCSCSMAAAPS